VVADDGTVVVVMPCCSSPVTVRLVEVHPRAGRRMACARCRRAWRMEFLASTEAASTAVVWTLVWAEPRLPSRRGLLGVFGVWGRWGS
jgi:hypothetical protein